MLWLRALLVVGCLGGVTVAAATAPWKAGLVHDNTTWFMQLGQYPIWSPPATPDYEAFRQRYGGRDRFPQPDQVTRISIEYDLTAVGFETVVYSWPVLLLCGCLYQATRGPRRDLMLHCARSVAWGVIVAGVACVALWVVGGGWGPPFVGCFVVLAVFGGLLSGLMSFADPVPEPPPG